MQYTNIYFSTLKWYDKNKRNLPWRKTRNPYKVWISEIMLQQTQVKTVIPYFKNFIKKFPSQKSLSEASEDQVLAAWSGLGFYRRARNIFATKEIIKKNYGNRFPNEFKKIIELFKSDKPKKKSKKPVKRSKYSKNQGKKPYQKNRNRSDSRNKPKEDRILWI